MGPAMQRRRALPGTKIDALCTPKSQTLWVYTEQEAAIIINNIESIVPNDINLEATYTEIKDDYGNVNAEDGSIKVDLKKNEGEYFADENLDVPEASAKGITARTKCTYIHVDPVNRSCSRHGDTVIGRAFIRRGTPSQACKLAKKSANNSAPRGCQAKHCSPCTYE